MTEPHMSDPSGSDSLSFGSSPSRPSHLRRAAAVGSGLVVLAAGAGALSLTGVATAASPSPTPSAGTTTAPAPGQGAEGGKSWHKGHGERGLHIKGGPGFGGMPLHATAVVRTPDGKYATVDSQIGKVTAVSATSITVKSEDGFSKTYVVAATTIVKAESEGISSVKVGDTVDVMGTESGSTATAKFIVDQTQVAKDMPGFGGRHGDIGGDGPDGPDGPGGPGKPGDPDAPDAPAVPSSPAPSSTPNA